MPKRKSSASAKKDVLKEKRSKQQIHCSDDDFVDEVVEKNDDVKKVVENGGADAKLETPTPDRKGGNKEEEEEDEDGEARFLGEPVPAEEAKQRWPHRYQGKQSEFTQAICHFVRAEVDTHIFYLEDDAFVKAEEGNDSYICKIIEFFQAVDKSLKFTAQWYYRAEDTVIKTCGHLVDKKQVFFSEIKDDNPLNCLVRKLKIEFLPLKDGNDLKADVNPSYDFYYNKMYLLPYTSFVSVPSDDASNSNESGSIVYSDGDTVPMESPELQESDREKTLLDLYSGCGAMSTGLCLGANSGGVKLVTKWAVDFNQYACESLRLNHPETQVRHESAEDFYHLIIEWEKLCTSFLSSSASSDDQEIENKVEEDDDDDDDFEQEFEIFEVEEILGICHGDPNKDGKTCLYFKIRWKGYGPEEDTWEPQEGLSDCKDKLKEFVLKGHKLKILPLPGSVDVICGGPPCQGISGFNRFRNKEAPLDDSKNKQLIVYMDIVNYLKPKYVLMENVVDIVKFAGGFLGRYAFGRLISSGYQVRMGMMAAGAYGLPQFRMRVFMWGTLPTEKLPQYPLPTHNVVVRGVIPTEFEMNTVAYEEGQEVNLKKALFLGDAISDLPKVENDEDRDEMPYGSEPSTEFQHFIRLRRNETPGHLSFNSEPLEHCLYDHRPLCLNRDDLERVCQIPKKKGANFRDLAGVRVRPDNKVEWDPDVERKLLTSGKPLVPDYAMSFVGGTSSKPFGRLWWDETVPTVVTRAEPHNMPLLHPNDDRVLTIRENARLQGFPDYYKLVGSIKERYMQVGNAVAVPVARALGYSLSLALRGLAGNEPLLTLPKDYPFVQVDQSPAIVMI